MTKADLFIQQFCYWVDRLGLKQITCRKDLRYSCHACFEYEEEKALVVNTRKLAKWNGHLVMGGVFHEIGHYIHNLPYDVFDQQVESEYQAERYALDMLKKYYPDSYKYNIQHVRKNNLGNKKWCKKENLHKEAYLLIEEYKEN